MGAKKAVLKNDATMKKINAIISMALSLALSACTKWVDPVTTGSLIAEKTVPVTENRNTFPVNIDGIWKASASEKWLSVNFAGYVKGEYAVTIGCASNESTPGRRNFARKGYVFIETYDHTLRDTIVIKQAGLKAEMALEDVIVDASARECLLPLVTNLTDEQRPQITFTSDKPWVGETAIAPDNVHVAVALTGGAAAGEEAVVTMCYTPVWGEAVSASCKITIKR